MSDEWRGEKFPSLFAYQRGPRFATPEEAARATPEERIASIWPYLCRRAMAFSRKLKKREYANVDPEDTAQELWLMLREKDCTWVAERGAYVSFAAALITRHLCTVRESSHTVRSPRNSYTRIRKLNSEAVGRKLSEAKERTLRDILRTEAEAGCVDEDCRSDAETPYDSAVESERLTLIGDAVTEGVLALTLTEARIIGRTYGLWGHLPETSNEVADDLERKAEYVKRHKANASAKIRERLLAMGHPAVASDN